MGTPSLEDRPAPIPPVAFDVGDCGKIGSSGVFAEGLLGAGVIVTGPGLCEDRPLSICPSAWGVHTALMEKRAAIVAPRTSFQAPVFAR